MNHLDRLRGFIPTREQIDSNRWLAWLGPWLNHPGLWRWSRHGVALGVALGVFFGLIVPIAQIPLSIGASIVLRANVPAAVASTLISNPVTFGPIYYGAYQLGSWVTGDEIPADGAGAGEFEINTDTSLWQRIVTLGKPLLVGLAITATLLGLSTYGLISLFWRWRTLSKRSKRRRS